MFSGSGIRLASVLIGILFIIGLIALVNRFGSQLRQRFQASQMVTSTPTPTPFEFLQPESETGEIKGETNYSNLNQVPATGLEILTLPLLFTLLGSGLILRKLS